MPLSSRHARSRNLNRKVGGLVSKRFKDGIALGLGAFVTLILFYIMQAVIATDEARLDEAAQGRLLDFVRLEEDQDLRLSRENQATTTR